jgi:hypothetical protein
MEIYNDLGWLDYDTPFEETFQIKSLFVNPGFRGTGKSNALVVEALKKSDRQIRTMWGYGSIGSDVVAWSKSRGFNLTLIPNLYGTGLAGYFSTRGLLRVAVYGLPEGTTDELEAYLFPVVPIEQSDLLLIDETAEGAGEVIQNAIAQKKKFNYWKNSSKEKAWPLRLLDGGF